MSAAPSCVARAVLALITAITVPVGCVRSQEASGPVTLRMGAAKPSTTMAYLRTSLTRDYLVSSGEDGRPTPRLLESWSASADGRVWHLRLRPGVRFHDGSVLTAADIVPAIENLRESVFAVSSILTAQPLDDMSIEVRLAEPSAFFLEDLAAIYAEKVAGADRIGTGPFIVESQAETEMSLRSFPSYYRGRPAIDRLEIETYEDLRNAWSALMRNEIDFLYELSREARDFVEAESSVEVSTFLRPYVILLGFNPSGPKFRSQKVRQALNAAVDRERLVAEGLKGQGVPATSHVWLRNWAFQPATAQDESAPSTTARLLDEAGLREVSGDGGMPARLRFKAMVYEPLQRIALALQRQLAQRSIDMELEVLPTSELIRRITTGDFEAFLFEMSAGRSLKWGYLFWHSKGGLRGQFGIDYDSADASLDRIRTALTDDAVRAGVEDFQEVLAEDPPAVFLAWGELARASSRRFEIPDDVTEPDVLSSIWRWKPAGDSPR